MLSNQDSSDIKSQIVFPAMIVLVEVIRHSVGNVQNRVEDNLTVSVEVDPVHGRVRLFAKTLVKIDVILFVDFVLVPQPQSLVSVDLFPFENCFLYFLCFLLLGLVCLLDLQVFLIFSWFSFDWFLDFDLSFVVQQNWEVNEF